MATVNYADLSVSRPATTTSNLLQGASPGLYVSQNSGKPGAESVSIKIRGIGTLNNSDPLVIIDGFEGSIDRVSPADIETVSILKDAASCAIYGNRGANGVILVTTKSAKEGRFNIEYNGMWTYQEPSNHFDVISDYADYMEFMNESAINVDKAPLFSQTMIDLWREKSKDPHGISDSGYPNYVAYPNVDWMDAIYENSVYKKHTVSANGLINDTRYLISLSYMDNPGLIANTGSKRFTYRLNLSSKPKKWMEIGGRFYGFRNDSDLNDVDGSFNFQNRAVPGIYPYYDGKYGWMENAEQDATSRNNLYFINRADGQEIVHYLNATAYMKIDLPLDIKYNASFNYSWRDGLRQYYTKIGNAYSFSKDTWGYNYSDLSKLTMSNTVPHSGTWTFQTDFNWKKTLKEKHDIAAIIGFEAFEAKDYSLSASKTGAENDVLHQMNNMLQATTINGSTTDFATASIFGRATYAYDEKYLAEINLRYDGSSRFARNTRWDLFPSFSAGWRISQEEFMKDSAIDNLKLRFSWGQLGNHSVDNYAYHSIYNSGYYYPFGGTLSAGYVSTLSNNLLEWERTSSIDVGLEFATLRNRLTFEFDYYNKYTDGILYNAPVYLTIGNKVPPVQNLCAVTNNGIEFSLGWRDRIGELSYGISGNFTRNWNRVSKYKGTLQAGWNTDENGIRHYTTNLGDVSTYVDATRRVVEGKLINEFRVLNVYNGSGEYFFNDGSVNPNGGPKDGMIRSEADMAWLNAMVEAGNTFLPNKHIGKTGIWYGDYIYQDINGDGIYGNDNDYTFQNKNQTPKFFYGFTTNLSWKGLDFSAQFVGAGGSAMYWRYVGFNSYSTGAENTLPRTIAYDHYFYNPDAPDDPRTNLTSKHGRLTLNNGSEQSGGSAYSNHWLYSTDYLKLKNITIGYTFPKRWIQTAGINDVRIFLSGDNLYTFTNYPGLDPEFADKFNYYALLRQYTVGVNVKF